MAQRTHVTKSDATQYIYRTRSYVLRLKGQIDMKRAKILILAVLVAGSTFALNGCLAAAAGFGIAKATEGDEVYVCENAPAADTKSELQSKMAAESPEYDDHSGEKVEIKQKAKVEVNDQTRNVIFVESEDFEDSRFWVPFSSVCRSE